jgi:hypothetical protein
MRDSIVLFVFVIAYGNLISLFEQKRYPELLVGSARNLQDLNNFWISRGKPANFNIEDFLQTAPPYNYFVYTNTITVTGAVYHAIVFHTNFLYWPSRKSITVTGAVYHCRFGVRPRFFPLASWPLRIRGW